VNDEIAVKVVPDDLIGVVDVLGNGSVGARGVVDGGEGIHRHDAASVVLVSLRPAMMRFAGRGIAAIACTTDPRRTHQLSTTGVLLPFRSAPRGDHDLGEPSRARCRRA
jgi:hypothetical protein